MGLESENLKSLAYALWGLRQNIISVSFFDKLGWDYFVEMFWGLNAVNKMDCRVWYIDAQKTLAHVIKRTLINQS